jgi:hypothetical protein
MIDLVVPARQICRFDVRDRDGQARVSYMVQIAYLSCPQVVDYVEFGEVVTAKKSVYQMRADETGSASD